VADGVKRLLRPAVEREARHQLREEALKRAVTDFGRGVVQNKLRPTVSLRLFLLRASV
jgi:hypothetical protein